MHDSMLTVHVGRLPALRTSDCHRVTPASWGMRATFLVDALIDRAHREWPEAYALLHIPTGEVVFLPAHRDADPHCTAHHGRYFADRVRPYCTADAIPHRRGSSRLRPIVLDAHPSDGRLIRYPLDLRTGRLSVGPGR